MEEWTCIRCGDAFFGIPPECGLCIGCQEEIGMEPGCDPERCRYPSGSHSPTCQPGGHLSGQGTEGRTS